MINNSPIVRVGDVIENPVAATTIAFLQTGAETNGELLQMDVYVRPSAFVHIEHIHAGLDAGTQGSYFFDAFKSTRSSYIGPTVVGVSASEATATVDADLTANVVEEDLSLDDVGAVGVDDLASEQEEAPNGQIFLPLISR